MYALPISNCNIVNPFIRLPATVSLFHLHVFHSYNEEPGSFQVLFVPTLQDVMDRACMHMCFWQMVKTSRLQRVQSVNVLGGGGSNFDRGNFELWKQNTDF